MEELPKGFSFAGYRVEGVAGRGGMGVVYCALDLALERSVALKVIAPDLAGNAEFRRRFTIESRVAASIDHPNVIPIYQAGEAEGLMFLTMRYVEGHDLRSLVREETRLSPERAARIVAQIASALDAAHEAGLVHRDVKPANVLVTARDHVYLMDFGLTKRLASDHEVTGTGTLLGTLNYVAPEQIRGEEIGPRTDVYALGGTLFQLLTGRVPFPLETDEGKLWAHLSEPPPAASAVCAEVPKAFDEVISRAMSKRPEDRFDTAGELGEAALAAAGSPPSPPKELRSQSPSQGPPKQAILRRALLDPFALVLLVLMLAAGLLVNFLVVLPIAIALYGASVTRAYLDDDVRGSVTGRDERPAPVAAPVPRARIDAMVEQAVEKEAQIRESAPSSGSEVVRELDQFDSTIRRTAEHAKVVESELHDTSASAIERRIAQLESAGDPRHARLVATLKRQLSTRRAMEEHMRLFYQEMDETLNELDAVGSELESASPAEAEQLAADVRGLRRGMHEVDENLTGARGDLPLDGGEHDLG